ncbi:hypothetical protein M9978_08125 [Sphingomonas sp. MG17]|uniref:Glycosyltransferase RgtA/B/C/D-like domain-containing protein n=1 Tax=Sphingomonas tagetis TaxID=2949092 RepID=A0A9X2HR73_9SPHN|nr:hypothetical protein [Sphingomonas tagetis]MCP3730395.1 hypothetical protein [Sphingomonas tagetis]
MRAGGSDITGTQSKPVSPAKLAALVFVPTLAIYWLCWRVQPPDLEAYLYRWLDHIRAHGTLGAFAIPFSNYNPPYLYLLAGGAALTGSNLAVVKTLSILSVLCAAVALWRVARRFPGGIEAALLVPILPTILANGIVYGQCDGFWVAAVLMAIDADMDDSPFAMAAWAGLGFAFKAQAAFIAPYVIGRLLARRASPAAWLLPAMIFAVALAPAWAAGWPFAHLSTIYLRQADYFNTISTAPGPWAIVALVVSPRPIAAFAFGYLAAALAAAAIIRAVARRRQIDFETMLAAALLSALLLPFLLPKMHERFLLLADLLSIILAVARPTRRWIAVTVMVQTASALAILGAMSDLKLLPVLATPLSLAAILALVQVLARPPTRERD